MSRHVPTRSLAAVAVALGLMVTPESVRAQIAGESVNMVTGLGWPGGDPYLQRQNEPSIAVSSANPEHLLAGANDYRTVDIAKAPADKMPGDAWAGIFKSLDGGKTWKSYLMPGYPQDPARYAKTAPFAPLTGAAAPPLMWCGVPTVAVPEVRDASGAVTTAAAPATDGTCTSAADPVVRAGADGMFYFGGITFQRFTNYGKVYLARFIDLNNKENGDATMGTDPIRFVDQKVVALGSATDFVDKPWIAVDVPRASNPVCTVTVVNPNKTTTKRSFPGHTIYVAYLRLTNGQTQSDVMVRHSDDCGATWAPPVKVNDATSPANEGPSLAIDPVKGHVYVTWRRVGVTDAAGAILKTNAIMISRSFSRATKFTRPREVATVFPFDQETTNTGFRVTLFPSSAISVDGAGVRRLHVAWAERVAATNDARVVVATKRLSPPPITEIEDDENDSTCQRLDQARPADFAPIKADATPIPGAAAGGFNRGHQFMPSITFSQGKLMLVYYDSRLDHTRAYFKPNIPFTADATGSFYEVIRGPLGAPAVSAENIPVGPDNQLDPDADVFNAFVDDGNLTKVRHTVDVRVASALPSDAPTFDAAQLSKFPFGTRGDEAYLADASGSLAVPGFGADLQIVANKEVKLLQQLKVNPPNLPMFKGGTKPFFGDYIDIQGPAFVKKAGKWVFNNDVNPSPVFHAVWTSNEDVKAPPDGRWDLYAPINVQGPSRVDPTQQTVACTPATALYAASRNQNIYTSRITEGLLVSSPHNSKPLSATQVRSFVIAAHNATNLTKTLKFTFAAPAGVTASFRALPGDQLGALATVTADVAPHSTVSRSLFVKATTPSATITATVTEQGGALASGFVLLNPPGATPGLIAPDGGSAITGGETYTPIQVAANLSNANLSNANLSNANLSNANLSNANLSNANLSNANLSNANLSNANLSNSALANLSNANLSNANLSNANLSNANLSNANLSNANLSNANLSNANLSNASISDLNYEYQNTGNTSTAYSIRIVGTKPAAGEVLQLIIAKTYTTPTAVGCELKEEAHNHILASIDDVSGSVVPSTTKVNPGVGDGSVGNATVVLAPGEKVQITLRGNVTLARMAEIGATLAPRPVAQRIPIGGTNGTTTYAQYAPRGATTTALSYDGSAVFTATVKDAALAAVTSGSVNFVAAGDVFLGTVQLGAGGTASFTPVGLPSGSTVTTYYSGSNAFLPSQGSLTTTAFGVTVSPATVELAPGGQQMFVATVSGTLVQNVTWSVVETGGGVILTDGNGYYTAPAAPGTYHVRATSSADPTKSGIATVIVSGTITALDVSPAAPTLVVGQTQAFTASVNGAIIPGITWTVSPGAGAAITAAGDFTASQVGTFTVTATSATGTLSGSVTFTVSATVPGAPAGLMVTGAPNSQVSLAWSPPASDGGSPIAGYMVTVTSAAGTFVRDAGMVTTTTVGTLTNGIAYTFTVAAYNAVGSGTGPQSNPVTATPLAPVTVPGEPTGLTATVGNGLATLGWTAPASDGGTAITGYDVTMLPAPPGGALLSFPGTTAVVIGLTNGQSYTFTVVARNVIGPGSPSVASSAFTPRTVPDAPTGLMATVGNGSATLGWTAPASDGGSAITGYTVVVTPPTGVTVTMGVMSASVTGLTNGVAYTFTVAAINGAGTGPASLASTFTPRTVPDAPTGLTATAGNGSATLGWTAPASNGSAITGYTVAVAPPPPGGGLISVPGTTASVTGLTNGQSYTFTVAAINGAGTGPASAASSAFTPTLPPAPAPFGISGAINNGLVFISVNSNFSSYDYATVTVTAGGVTLNVPRTAAGIYSTNSFVLPAGGQTVTFTVTDGVNTATGSGTVPAAATITAPAAGSTIPSQSPLTVSWTSPSNPNWFVLDGYCGATQCIPGSWTTVAGSARDATLPAGLFPAGQTISMELVASNDLALSGYTLPTSYLVVQARAPATLWWEFLAAAVPGAPTSVVATAGNGSASLTWAAPASDGGSAITGYAVAISPAVPLAVVDVVGTTATVSGLTNGTAYTFTVAAINAAGAGPWSASSNAVTPTGPARLKVSGMYGRTFGSSSTLLGVSLEDEAGAPVTDALVQVQWTVNAVTNSVPLPVVDATIGQYQSLPQGAFPEGTQVRFIVTRGTGSGASRVEGQGIMPGLPTISSPATGTQVPFNQPLTVNFSGAFNGRTTYFLLDLAWGQSVPYLFNNGAFVQDVTSLDVPAGTIPVGATAQIWVTAMQQFDLTGDLVPSPGAVLFLDHLSDQVEVTGATGFVAPLQAASTVAGNGYASFFLMPNGMAKALGTNLFGQLGTNAAVDAVAPTPRLVFMESGVQSIDAASNHGLALDILGRLWVWGLQTATGVVTAENIPIQILSLNAPGQTITAISAGYSGGLALRSDGLVFGFGEEVYGALGPAIGNKGPRQIPGLSGIVAVAAGEQHNMALASDGTVWTLGASQFGQLGDGTISAVPNTTPTRVLGLIQIVAIAAGSFHSVALRGDGTVWTWGKGTEGQLGNGAIGDSSIPVQVVGLGGTGFLTNVQAIATGNNHTLARLGDGTLVSWGYNAQGQLGDGSFVDSVSPVAVIGLANITDMAGGEWHSVARRADGTIWAWGSNESSQLGTGAASGPGAYSPLPVQVGAVTVTVTPATATVGAGGTQAFTAVVAGAVDQSVVWSVQETGGGTISSGLYTAPATAGTYTVQAQSAADPSKIGTAIVTVMAAAPPVIVTAIWDGAIYIQVMNQNGSVHAVDTVTVTTLSGNAPLSFDGIAYNNSGVFTLPPAGQTVTVTVTGNGLNAIGTTTVPARPIVIAPGLNSLQDAASPLSVSWSMPGAAANPDFFMLYGPSVGTLTRLPPADRSAVFPAGYFVAGTNADLRVEACNSLAWTGQVTPSAQSNEVIVSAQQSFLPTIFATNALVTPRVHHQAVSLAGHVYSMGGYNTSPNYLSSMERYDTQLGQSVLVAPMAVARQGFGAVEYGGKIYVFGGSPAPGSYTASTEVYDPGTNLWTTLAPMPMPRFNVRAAYLPATGLIYVVGGFSDTGPHDRVDAYHPGTNTWSFVGYLEASRTSFALAASGNALYAIGGYASYAPQAPVSVMEVLSNGAAPGAFASGPPFFVANGPSAISTNLGNIVLIGSSATNYVQIFTPGLGTWSLPSSTWELEGGAPLYVNPVGYAGFATDGSLLFVTGGQQLSNGVPTNTIVAVPVPVP